MKVRYDGKQPVYLPTLGIRVNPGDICTVPDDFSNANFSPVSPAVDPVKAKPPLAQTEVKPE